ncbi:hypothetical protein JW948_18675 [bacterium]|nr:hypothetical protein [bacterium]
MKKTILLILILPISYGCWPVIPHQVPLHDYAGTWVLTGSVYPGSGKYLNEGTITLSNDSTCHSNFSFFWTADTLQGNDSLEGSWYPWQDATYHDDYYIEIHIQIEGEWKSWRTSGSCKTGSMEWYSDEYGRNNAYTWTLQESD